MAASRRGARTALGRVLGIAFAAAASAAGAQSPSPCPTCSPPGAPVDAGATVRRDVVPAIFEIAVDPTIAQVTATVLLGDATMNGIMLDYRRPIQAVSVAAGPCSLTGSLMLRLNEAPGVSAVYLDGVITAPPDPAACVSSAPARDGPAPVGRAFRGDLMQWHSPIGMILLRDRRFLSGLIVVQTDVVRGQVDRQAVNLTFYSGAQLMWSVAVPENDIVTLIQDVRVGQNILKQGARFTFVPPSPVGPGTLTAQNLTIVTSNSTVDASGILATWPAPPAGWPPVPPATNRAVVPARRR